MHFIYSWTYTSNHSSAHMHFSWSTAYIFAFLICWFCKSCVRTTSFDCPSRSSGSCCLIHLKSLMPAPGMLMTFTPFWSSVTYLLPLIIYVFLMVECQRWPLFICLPTSVFASIPWISASPAFCSSVFSLSNLF